MANLLSWLGGEAKTVANNYNPFYKPPVAPPSNLQRAQQSIANANQQIQATPPRFGVLANPQDRINLQQSIAPPTIQAPPGFNTANRFLQRGANIVNNDALLPVIRPVMGTLDSVVQNLQQTAQAATGNKQAQQQFLKDRAVPKPGSYKDGKYQPNPEFTRYVQNFAGIEGAPKGPEPPDFLKPSGNSKAPQTPTPTGTPKTAANFDPAKNAAQNPLLNTVPARHVLPGDAAQAHLNADFVAKHEQTVGGKALQAVNSLSPADQELMKSVQTKGASIASKAENPQAFKSALDLTRNYYDLRHAYDHSLGIQTPYRQNYLRDLVQRNDTNQNFTATGGSKAPGYTQAKTQPGVTNVTEALQRDVAGASFNHAKLTYAQGMEEAFPGSISRGSPIVGKNGVTQQLQTPYGNELFASKDVASGINKRAPAQTATGITGAYDKVNPFLKYVKLSGGAFHAVTEAGNFVGQQLASGKLFTEPGSTGKVFKTFFSDKALRDETSALRANGTMDKANLGGLTWTPSEIKADVNITPTGTIAKATGIKQLHDATFQREIPYMKLKTFEQRTQGLDINNPADVAKLRSTAKAVNAEFGGINRTVEGITPQNAKRLSRVLLASDFTESKIQTIINAISKGGEEGKLAREVVAGKALLFGGLAVAGGAVGGELGNKNTNDQIRTVAGKILDPSFNFGSYKVSLPATHPSEFIAPLKSFVNGDKDKFYGLKHYTTGRLAAVPSEVNQLVNNQDYKGAKIYGGTKTKPISGKQAALNVASGVLPIPFSQGVSAATGQQSVPAAIANTVGLRAYQPTPSKPPTASSEVADLKKNTPKTYSLQQTSDGKYAYNLNGTIKTTVSLTTARQAIAKDAFANSDQQTTTINGKTYTKDANGNVHTSTPKPPKVTVAKTPKVSTKKASSGKTKSSKAVSYKVTKSAKAPAQPKGVSVRAPKFTAPKTTKLSVYKIPKTTVKIKKKGLA